MNDIYAQKAKKYKYKYLKLKEELYGGVEKNTCKYTLLKNKKANCDRIIYKTNNKITFLEYNVIDSNIYEILKLSDHKMIYGIFEYNNKKYMILSWNMSNFDVNLNEDKQNYIENDIKKFINEFLIKKEFDYLIFSFQESRKESFFIETLKNNLKIHFNNNHYFSKPNFLVKDYIVHLLVFSKLNNQITDSGMNNLQTLYKDKYFDIKQNIKNLLGTKSYVYIEIDELIIISTHFPIDNRRKKDLGNELRISAFNKIKDNFKNNDNVVIIGDLNFRKNEGKDQLTELLIDHQEYKEPIPELTIKTCKYNKCKLECIEGNCILTN